MIPGSPGSRVEDIQCSYGYMEDENGYITRWGPGWIAYGHKDQVVQVDIIDEDKEVNCPIKWKRKDGS